MTAVINNNFERNEIIKLWIQIFNEFIQHQYYRYQRQPKGKPRFFEFIITIKPMSNKCHNKDGPEQLKGERSIL